MMVNQRIEAYFIEYFMGYWLYKALYAISTIARVI